MYAGYPNACDRRPGNLSALRASEAFLSTRGGPFRLFLPPPCPPALTAPGEGLHGGLLEGSCGRRRRRRMSNHQKLNDPTYLFQNMNRALFRRRYDKQLLRTVNCPPFSVLRNIIMCA